VPLIAKDSFPGRTEEDTRENELILDISSYCNVVGDVQLDGEMVPLKTCIRDARMSQYEGA